MPSYELANYLRFGVNSSLARIDAIVCSADSIPMSFKKDGTVEINYSLDHAMIMSWEARDLPDSCTMSDGRKWRSLPFIIFHSPADHELAQRAAIETHAKLVLAPRHHPPFLLAQIEKIVEQHHGLLLKDYEYCGIIVRLVKGRAQINPALKLKTGTVNTEHYNAAGDRRKSNGWVTFSRNREGLANDVELFEELLSRKATETEMHKFFTEHPAILMEARKGVPVSHGISFTDPKNWRPDFAFSPILGPLNFEIELLELKGPDEKTLTQRFHPGFTRKVHAAIDQVRDYEHAMRDPANFKAIRRALGFLPANSRLAVLIGRNPDSEAGRQTLERRKGQVVDVEIITYDEIFETQARQA